MPKQKSKTNAINLILKKGFWYSRKLNICLDDETFITLESDKKSKITPKYCGLNIKIGNDFLLFGHYNISSIENVRDIEFVQKLSGATKCFIIYKNGQKQRIIDTSNYFLLMLILLFTLLSWL